MNDSLNGAGTRLGFGQRGGRPNQERQEQQHTHVDYLVEVGTSHERRAARPYSMDDPVPNFMTREAKAGAR